MPRLDIAGYGGGGITGKGRTPLQGEGAFLYREDTVAVRPSGTPRRTRGKEADFPLSGEQAALLGVLKALRLQLARERNHKKCIDFSK